MNPLWGFYNTWPSVSYRYSSPTGIQCADSWLCLPLQARDFVWRSRSHEATPVLYVTHCTCGSHPALVSSCPCVYEVPFGNLILTRQRLPCMLLTALAVNALPWSAKRNGGDSFVGSGGDGKEVVRYQMTTRKRRKHRKTHLHSVWPPS